VASFTNTTPWSWGEHVLLKGYCFTAMNAVAKCWLKFWMLLAFLLDSRGF